MDFRTEIEIPRTRPLTLGHSSGIVMLGSCFTDNIGSLLDRDGFKVVHNPMGTLYNPCSIAKAIGMALRLPGYEPLFTEYDGIWRCLDFATAYSGPDRESVIDKTGRDLSQLGADLTGADTVIITLGTAWVYRWHGRESVGNCHKIPAREFTRTMLSIDDTVRALRDIIGMLGGKQVVFTVSPIRHTADTLHGNQLSKATLLTAVDAVVDNVDVFYFPAYEIMLDDLRDYRFYAADMKHPSDVAIEYIYDVFTRYYFNDDTKQAALVARKQYCSRAHRPILPA